MKPLHYAVVAYVTNPVGRFVESVREELYPEHAHLAAHLTLLPPRPICGSEADAIAALEQQVRAIEPFEVVMDAVETFMPTTPTVFIAVAHGGYRMREIHDRLNEGVFSCHEPWPYMPHLTIVKTGEAAQALKALEAARERWSQYSGTKRILVDQLTFVREGENNRWVDLADLPLRNTLVSRF